MSSPSSENFTFDPRTGNGVVHPVQRAQKGRLAAARRTDKGSDIVHVDIDRHVVDRLFLAIENIDVSRRDFGDRLGRVFGCHCLTSGFQSGCGGRWRLRSFPEGKSAR